jgi:two-component system, OmpR family, sensor kinase
MFRRLEGKRQAQRAEISDKRRWVRGLVHDIQNSLGAIQANFDYVVMQSEVRDQAVRQDFEDCLRETRSIFREMVRNLRTVSEFERFEAGDVALREDEVLLSVVSQSVSTGLRHLASNLHKTIVVDSLSYSSPVHGDEKYLVEAISDLASFVLRQTDNQKCFLHAASADGFARLKVYGDRHQIPTSARAAIFDPYAGHTRGKPAHTAHKVGLALARIIVEAHRGTVQVEDVPGAGSAFVVEFPTRCRIRE